jgi:hypothetical protein
MTKAELKRSYENALKEIVMYRVPPRKGRYNHRGVKRKMSSYHIRTKAHAAIAARASKPKVVLVIN